MIGFFKQGGAKAIGRRIEESDVEKSGDAYVLKSDGKIRVDARSFKMSKSRGNVVNPDQIVGDYGADTFRLYEMYMGPLEQQKPWNTRDIVGMSRFLAGVYRNLIGDEETGKMAVIADEAAPQALDRQMHRTIKKVGQDIDGLRFNTAIAQLIMMNNEMTKLKTVPRALAENFTLMLSPFAPHLAEEIWNRLGHDKSLSGYPWPKYDEGKLVDATVELAVQVNGKLRGTVSVPSDADEETALAAARGVASVKPWIEGKTPVKSLYVAKKLVNLVVR